MTENNVLLAFALTFIAGISTGIGSLLAFLSKDFSPKYLSGSLGFSAGVMIYVSMVEMFPKAKDSLVSLAGDFNGYLFTILSFFGGVALIAIIDRFVPSFENPHEIGVINRQDVNYINQSRKLLRTGVLSAFAITIHNFPEGLATFFATLSDPFLGVSIAIAIAIHNIPEGIVVSVPIYYATQNRKKAFVYSFLSGFAEPVGAIVGYILLRNFLNPFLFGIMFAGVAGIMVFISLDELLPTAEKFGEHHIAIYGLVGGMVVMAISLLMLIR
ncbi:MAG: Metal transporter, ZIP family [Candidatus Kapaibacterium sp.]|nr:MAG: Metal transporter, ZIP family [Candidatus Kapabacteria bacterium]